MRLTQRRAWIPPWRHRLQALLAYLVLAALFYSPLLLGLRTFPKGDFTDHFLPFSLFQRAELLAGRLPVWNPYTFSGHPFLADVQAAVFYPVSNLVLALTLPFGSPAARLYCLEVEAALQVALAGFFTYLLVHDLTGRKAAAFVAGCVFAFSGYLTGYPPLQLAVLRTAIWLPLVLWLLLRAFTRDHPWRWTVGASLAYVAALLAGHSQTLLFVSYAAAAWILLLAVRGACAAARTHASSPLPRYAGQVLTFYGLFLALGAAQLWPSLEFTSLSVRANVDYAFVSGGFSVSDTWQMLLPKILTYFSPLYVGIVALGLASVGVAGALAPRAWLEPKAASRRPERPFVLFFAALAVLALLASFGDHGFLYPLFYRWLPGWNYFRGQERAAYLVACGLSVLAGCGVATVQDAPARFLRIAWGTFGLLAAAGILLFLFVLVPARVVDVAPADIQHIPATTLLFLCLGTAICLWPNSRRFARDGPLRLALLAGVIVADLFLANVDTDLAAGSPASAAALPPEAAALQADVQAQAAAHPELAARAYNEYRIYEDYGMRVGVEDTWGSSPLRLARYETLFQKVPQDRLWQLAGVQHVLTYAQALARPSERLAEFPGPENTTTYLHRLTRPTPRAWVVNSARLANDDQALGLLASPDFKVSDTVLLADDLAQPTDAAQGAKGAGQVSVRWPEPGHLVATVDAERAGYLVVAENWMPGWRATLASTGGGTGQTTRVLRANLTFLAVPIPAGSSVIDLAYQPASVRCGLAISGAALLGLLGGCVLARRRKRASV